MAAEPILDLSLARLKIQARAEFLPAVSALVREVARQCGLPPHEVPRFENAVDEACTNVVQHAYGGAEEGTLEVILGLSSGRLVAAVEDRGLPFDPRAEKEAGRGGIGSLLMSAFADEVRYINLGPGGKRVELVKNIPGREEGLPSPDAVPAREPPAPEVPLEIRPARPGDAMAIARCAHRAIGHSASFPFLCHAGQIEALLSSGRLACFVAAAQDGEAAAVSALLLEHAGLPVGEIGGGIEAPAFEGRSLSPALCGALVEHAAAKAMLGLVSEVPAMAPKAQKTLLGLGSVETGCLLGRLPAEMPEKGRGGSTGLRKAVFLHYIGLRPAPPRDVFAPLHHRGVLRKIYDRASAPRTLREPFAAAVPVGLRPYSRVELRVKREACRAEMILWEAGADLLDEIRRILKDLCLQRVDCIHLDLPLSKPSTAALCAPLEGLGFFFGGVVPEVLEGDALRLQYLNNVPVDRSKFLPQSEFAGELLEYVLKSRGEA